MGLMAENISHDQFHVLQDHPFQYGSPDKMTFALTTPLGMGTAIKERLIRFAVVC